MDEKCLSFTAKNHFPVHNSGGHIMTFQLFFFVCRFSIEHIRQHTML